MPRVSDATLQSSDLSIWKQRRFPDLEAKEEQWDDLLMQNVRIRDGEIGLTRLPDARRSRSHYLPTPQST